MKPLIFLASLFTTGLYAQQLSSITNLSSEIEASSGLIYLDNRLITINDDASDVALYEIEPATGDVSRTVSIMKANNEDWEGISADNSTIYICDIGNNDGLRHEFKIYLVKIDDYLNYDVVEPHLIKFSYPNLSSGGLEFNSEASVVVDDKIYLFTKSAVGVPTEVYSIPTSPGTYEATFVTSLDLNAVITDATLSLQKEILLTGLNNNGDLSISKLDVSNDILTLIEQQEFTIPSSYSSQIEGICALNSEEYYVSSKLSATGSGGLYSLEWASSASIKDASKMDFSIQPNPADQQVTLQTEFYANASVYSVNGALIWQGDIQPGLTSIETAQWNTGMYVITLDGEFQSYSQKLVVK